MELLNKGSLITYQDGEIERCLGSLMAFDGRGVFDASLGKVDVTKEECEAHNKLLDEAMVKGLDENCQIGQRGTFYLMKRDGRNSVETFAGYVVSGNVIVNGKSITFYRNGKEYRGRAQKDADCFNFRRVK